MAALFIPSLGQAPGLRRHRIAALSVVAGLHAVMGVALWQSKLAVREKRSEPTQSVMIQLIAAQAERRRDPQRDRQARKAGRFTSRAQSPPGQIKPLESFEPLQPPQPLQRLETPALPSILLVPVPAMPGSEPAVLGSGQIGLDGKVVAAPGLAASRSAGLDLVPSKDVLRGALANPATSDPRSNSPKPTVEERIAMALDPGLCLLAERLPDGSIRRRLSRWRRVQSTMSAVHAQGQGQARICE